MVVYRIEQDELFKILICCIGFDYHSETCTVCQGYEEDLCDEGEKIFKVWLAVLNEFSYKDALERDKRNAGPRLQAQVKHRGSGLRWDTSQGTSSVRSDEGRPTDSKDGTESQELDKARRPRSDSHSQDEQNRSFPGTTITNKDVA